MIARDHGVALSQFVGLIRKKKKRRGVCPETAALTASGGAARTAPFRPTRRFPAISYTPCLQTIIRCRLFRIVIKVWSHDHPGSKKALLPPVRPPCRWTFNALNNSVF